MEQNTHTKMWTWVEMDTHTEYEGTQLNSKQEEREDKYKDMHPAFGKGWK